jgi:hypothetical protein
MPKTAGGSTEPKDLPRFANLPDKNKTNLDFYKSSDLFTYRPRRYWYFLSEILDFVIIIRLYIEIENINGAKIPLYFYTDSRGNKLILLWI